MAEVVLRRGGQVLTVTRPGGRTVTQGVLVLCEKDHAIVDTENERHRLDSTQRSVDLGDGRTVEWLAGEDET